MSLARELPREATVVVQETEYTGAGKHHWAQLNFAREMGVEVRTGDPAENVPGKVIVIPERLEQIQAKDFDLGRMRKSYVRNALKHAPAGYAPTADDIDFLAADTNSDAAAVEALVAELKEALRWRAEDTYAQARGHLAGLSDEQLEARFWELVEQIVDPLVELARTHTSPTIERSVLMRMGIDSPTCDAVVDEIDKRGLLGHGAGHVVLHCAQRRGASRRARGGAPPRAGRRLGRGCGGARERPPPSRAARGRPRPAAAPAAAPARRRACTRWTPEEKLDLRRSSRASRTTVRGAAAGPGASWWRTRSSARSPTARRRRASRAACRCRRRTTSATSTRSPTAW